MQSYSNSPGPKIHVIEVPIVKDRIADANEWLKERLGDATWKITANGAVPIEDPDFLMMRDHVWDGYILPQSFRAFFRIKGHDDIALLFKLTFGGTSEV